MLRIEHLKGHKEREGSSGKGVRKKIIKRRNQDTASLKSQGQGNVKTEAVPVLDVREKYAE